MVAEQWEAEDTDAVVLAQCVAVLERLYERIAHRFGRAAVRARVRRYVMGLLERVERKNSWQVAEAIGEGDRRVSSACSPQPCGMPRPCATICAATWSRTWGTWPVACSLWMRPGSSRKARISVAAR